MLLLLENIFMSKKEKFIQIIRIALPYLAIILASFFSLFPLFYDGIASGDDITFHLGQIYDIYYGMQHGYFGPTPNHVFMGGFGIYNQGFYGPVPHYSAAIIAFLTSWVGGTPIFGYKAALFLATILGGIYFYKFAMKLTKQNRALSLITAVLFVFLPYRGFCALSRCAFAEAIAICFIPMVFYGAYSIIFDDEYSVGPYIALPLGAAGVIMSHPFTGLMCAIFGLIFVIVNCKKMFRKRLGFSIWPSLVISIFCAIGLIGFYVINAITIKNSGLYRLCDPQIDWTNYEFVAESTFTSLDFSGFINISWIKNVETTMWWDGETISYLITSILVFFGSILLMLFVDHFIQKAPKSQYYRYFVDLVSAFIFCPILDMRVEIYLAIAIFFVVFTLVNIFKDYFESKHEESTDKKLLHNPNFYFFVGAIIFCLILMFVPDIWKIMPGFMYNCQFAWRLWGITSFLIAALIALLFDYARNHKKVVIGLAVAASALITVSMGVLEKRVYHSLAAVSEHEGDFKIYEDAEEVALNIRASGAQNEMVPLVFNLRYSEEEKDLQYTPEYSNSLYYRIRNSILTWQGFIYSQDDYINPVILEGNGKATITNYSSPNNEFNVEIKSETALIQFPQFYADGYVMEANGQRYVAKNVDGLIAFELPEGTYSSQIKFIGTQAYRIARPFFYASLGILAVGGALGLVYKHKTKKRKQKKGEELANKMNNVKVEHQEVSHLSRKPKSPANLQKSPAKTGYVKKFVPVVEQPEIAPEMIFKVKQNNLIYTLKIENKSYSFVGEKEVVEFISKYAKDRQVSARIIIE